MIRLLALSALCALLLLLPSFAGLSGAAAEPVWIRQRSFADLVKGTAGDSGVNLYVSAKGRIQTINRWDLNGDGELDLLFTQDHNDLVTPDALIYWGTPDGHHSLQAPQWKSRSIFSRLRYLDKSLSHITRLPAPGGGPARVADLNLDGFPDIVFCNQRHYTRTDMPAYIYWGSAEGFRVHNRTELPAYRANGLAVGDLDGDGFPEVVLSNTGEESVAMFDESYNLESFIYWGHAAGYDVSRRTSVATHTAADVCIGDFNGDGHGDLAFANNHGEETGVIVYRGSGGRSFDEEHSRFLGRKALRLEKGAVLNALFAADLDSDGWLDLVLTNAPTKTTQTTHTKIIVHIIAT